MQGRAQSAEAIDIRGQNWAVNFVYNELATRTQLPVPTMFDRFAGRCQQAVLKYIGRMTLPQRPNSRLRGVRLSGYGVGSISCGPHQSLKKSPAQER
jgi:hypothetical protein